VIERRKVHPVTVQCEHLLDEVGDRDSVRVEAVEVLDIPNALVQAFR